ILYIYVINLFLIIFVTNYKYFNQMFVNIIDRIIAQKGMLVSIVFIISIIALNFSMHIGMKIFNIENHKVVSFKNLLFLFPYKILKIIWLIKEIKKVDKNIKTCLKYILSKSTYILVILNILFIIGIFYNCYINKGV